MTSWAWMAIFWLSIAVVGFTYAGYPLVMAVLARLRPRPLAPRPATPSIDVMLVVHNAADALPAKIANLLALDYPADRLRIHIACDGCSDGSEAVARDLRSDRVRVTAFPQRRGKSACLGDVLPTLDADLVLFTDVRQRIDAGAAQALATALSDPSVGAASGELVLEAATGYGRGVDAYWRYEKAIRRFESASGSLVGATGALYAARRDALPHIPAGIVLDDMWIPLGVAERGLRIVFVPTAIAYDQAATDPSREEARKRRTLAGNYQLLRLKPALALPGAHPLALRLWGHKWLRLLAPWLLLLALVASGVLAAQGLASFQWLLAAQLAGYGVALLGRGLPWLARLLPVRLATAFVSLNTSAMLALWDYLRDPRVHLWQTTRQEGTGQ